MWPVLFLGGLVGWCGPIPTPRPPVPKEPVVGFVGGVIGAWFVYWALGMQGPLGAPEFVAIAIGAWATGRVLSDIVSFVFPGPPRS